MLDTRSKYRKVVDEKRRHPRLELHCYAVVRGMSGLFTVTDISLGGIFIEPQAPVIVKVGQIADIKIKLPEASKSIQVKVRVVNQTSRGIGCEFINLSQDNRNKIEDCLESFRYTMPIIKDQNPQKKTEPKAPKRTIQCPKCKRVKNVNLPNEDRRAIRVKLKCSCGHNWI
ncbi:MAG: PilZ domain-containing protein, partial [Deltaproteobacteria bacterium]|nr:PilZ domain-containing protein [Deltaproteobacteria bacterium]